MASFSFKDFIRNNNSIIRTLFHVDDSNIKIINDNYREIIKNYRTAKIFMFMPLLKDLLNEILKDVPIVQLKIIENYDKKNDQFNYTITIMENKLFENIISLYEFQYLLHLYFDKNNKKINVSLSMNKNKIEDDCNPLNKIIIMIMLNYFENEHPTYYKQVVLEKQLKPLITDISHHSLELNII